MKKKNKIHEKYFHGRNDWSCQNGLAYAKAIALHSVVFDG